MALARTCDASLPAMIATFLRGWTLWKALHSATAACRLYSRGTSDPQRAAGYSLAPVRVMMCSRLSVVHGSCMYAVSVARAMLHRRDYSDYY